VAKEHPLIRVPTKSVRLTLFEVFIFCGLLLGIFLGAFLGHRFFGHTGAIIGGIVGGILGLIIGILPRHLSQEQMFRTMQRSSDEQLKARLEAPEWSFEQPLALLNLQARGEDVQPYLARILARLESADCFQRIFSRDALRLVFTPLADQMDELGYDPSKSTEDCRDKIAKLREHNSRRDG
jgi:hypothetical protein